MIPIVAIPCVTAVVIAFSPLGKALAARRAGEAEPDPALLTKLEEQEGRLLMAEDEIEKLRERQAFTERLLSSPAGADSEVS